LPGSGVFCEKIGMIKIWEVCVEFNDSLSIGMDDFSNNEDMEIPEVLPMMAVRDVVVFNYMIIPLFVGRPGSVEAVNEALNKKLLMLVTQKDATKDNPSQEDLYDVGMVCMVMRTLKLPDGRLKVLVQAMSKARIKSFITGLNRPIRSPLK
jgi:ATP-dependent Lon protease